VAEVRYRASMRIRRAIAPVAVITAALALTACAPSATPIASTPSAVSSSTPTPTPSAAAVITAAIVIGPDAIELQDAGGGVIQTLSFTMDGADFVADLTDRLGFAPAMTENTGGLEFGPSTGYSWGGFEVVVAVGGTPGSQQPPIYVVATTSSLPSGAVVATRQGYRVGDDCFAIAEVEGASLAWSGVTDCDIATEFGVDYGAPEVDGYPNANSVELFGAPTVTRIVSPSNLGIGRV
jgi:hypothetical protein